MIDNNDGTVIYSKKEVDDINAFLDRMYKRVSDVLDSDDRRYSIALANTVCNLTHEGNINENIYK